MDAEKNTPGKAAAPAGRQGALSPYRVIDLTDSRAELGPMMLAELGADVIKVEPPGGVVSRWAEPLDPSLPPGQASMRFQAYNRNKRSVTIDLGRGEGLATFRRLVATADFLFENDAPGAMAARGIGYDALSRVNPRLVYVATTPFGQDGPYAQHLATDLTLSAMGGSVAVNGDADRPPLRISLPQAWLHAAAESAVGALVAHFRRVQTGEGQFVDVAVQTAVFWSLLNAMIASAVQGKDIERNGTTLPLGTIDVRVIFPCKDGYVLFAAVGARTLARIVPWLVADRIVPPSWLTDEDWTSFDQRLLSGQPTAHSYDEVIEAVERFTVQFDKKALLQRGIPEGIFIAPVNTVADVLEFEHLQARGYWQPQRLADGRTLRGLGPFARLSGTPIRYWRAAPAPGEDTEAVLAELQSVGPEVTA